MRVMVGIGEIVAEVEDDLSYTPECVADMLTRATTAAVTCFLSLPDVAPAKDE